MMKDTYSSLPVFHFARDLSYFQNSKNTKCLIFGNFGAFNSGDESILAGQISEIQKFTPGMNMTVVSRYPDQIRLIHGTSVHAIALWDIYTSIQAVFLTDIMIVGGGGLFSRGSHGLVGILYQWYFLLVFIGLPQLLRKFVLVTGIGIYENMIKTNLRLSLRLLAHIPDISVRDLHSFHLLARYNILSKIYKDNSYLMDLSTKRNRVAKDVTLEPSNKKFQVGFAFRTPFTDQDSDRLITNIKLFVQSYKDTCQFRFYTLDSHPNRLNDTYINERIMQSFHLRERRELDIMFMPVCTNPKELFGSFYSLNFIIAMRLHALLFAYRLHIKFMGISYDIKCTSFLTSIGEIPYTINTALFQNINDNFIKATR